jgi:hypothetical protein
LEADLLDQVPKDDELGAAFLKTVQHTRAAIAQAEAQFWDVCRRKWAWEYDGVGEADLPPWPEVHRLPDEVKRGRESRINQLIQDAHEMGVDRKWLDRLRALGSKPDAAHVLGVPFRAAP